MGHLQSPATPSYHCPHTREQVSGSSPLVGSHFHLQTRKNEETTIFVLKALSAVRQQ
jgi:hypothetical protein